MLHNSSKRNEASTSDNPAPSRKGKEVVFTFELDEKILEELLDAYWDAYKERVCQNSSQSQPTQEVHIECACCYSEHPFEEFVQCADAHLFCKDCLRRHTEEQIFGPSRIVGLPLCMDGSWCRAEFLWDEISRTIPADVLEHHQQRVAENAILQASIDGLVYCPFCNTPWELDAGAKFLHCPNTPCKKTSCLMCRGQHDPSFDCTKVEQEMTRAMIRVCPNCRLNFTKGTDCNMMTCPCGQMMCYVCRNPNIGTNHLHFCLHIRTAGKPCRYKDCSGCLLFQQDDAAQGVQAAKEAAIANIQEQEGQIHDRDIGPS